MAHIVIIGAGSGFGSRLSIDILSRESLKGSTIGLCDIHPGRLEQVRDYVQCAIEGHNLPARLVTSTNREDLLAGADCVVTAVSIGGAAYWGEPYKSEIEIPLSYGVHQTVADTIGVGGVFRFLRTADTHLNFARDMERLCPNALLLNYTNPMCMLTWLHSVGSQIENVGLCHSVQGTTRKLARATGIAYEDLDYVVAGINHQAWVLKLESGSDDLYPKLKEVITADEDFSDDRVRVEMMRQFGYFVTESSRHNAEYLPYFCRNENLRCYYGVPDRQPVSLGNDRKRSWMNDSGVDANGNGQIPALTSSEEYASLIIEARLTGTAFAFNGNVMNHGSITNLPKICCVEVPCLADRQGIHPTFVGGLPPQLAALNASNIAVQSLAVQAVLERDREAAFHACALDPLTAAVVPLPQIREMFEALWAAEGSLLDYFEEK